MTVADFSANPVNLAPKILLLSLLFLLSNLAFRQFPQFSLALFGSSALIDPHLMEAALKTEYTKEFKLHDKDTGSADVQIALLTHRINDLTKHLQKFKKDHSSRRGLLMMVAQRKKLQDYLKQSDSARYDKVIQKLNLRK